MGKISKTSSPLRVLIYSSIIVLAAGCASTALDEAPPPIATTPTPPPPVQPSQGNEVEEITVTGSRVEANEPDRYKEYRAQVREQRRQRKLAIAELNRRAEAVNQDRHGRIVINDDIISRPVDPTMVFKNYGVNPTVDTLDENTTTFSIDVDTASYNVAKGFLDQGVLPDADGIRVEEFVNSFDYGYRAPHDEMFSLQAEAFPSMFRRGFHVLHLGVKAKETLGDRAKRTNLTLLIDVSGSMSGGNRLEMLKDALYLMINQMKKQDTVGIVVYSTDARLVLEPTEARYQRKIKQAIAALQPENNTNIEAGIELAYRMANKAWDPERNNRIILCSDGVANVGVTNAERMMKDVSAAAKQGIYLNTVGVGMGNYNDVTLEELARQGQGQYGYINSLQDAKTLFVDRLLSSLNVVARDVRIQVEFDPLYVQSYRLLGYENRGMDNRDFNNAKKDAGEVGAGHSVTAIYEVKFRENIPSNNFGSFRINYKPLDSEQLQLVEHALPPGIVVRSASQSTANTQLSYIAAAFAEKLRGSYWSRTYHYDGLESWLASLRDEVANPSAANELLTYLRKADRLDHRDDRYSQIISIGKMSFDRVPVLTD